MLVYRQEPHTVHTGRGVDWYKPASPKCFQNESWLTVTISYNTRCKSSGIYKWPLQMKCSMITGSLVWVSHCTFIEFWVVGSNLAEWVQMMSSPLLTMFSDDIQNECWVYKGASHNILYMSACLYNWLLNMKCTRRADLYFWVSHSTFMISARFQKWAFPCACTSCNMIVVWENKQCINQRFCVTSVHIQNMCTMSDAIGMSLPQYMQILC